VSTRTLRTTRRRGITLVALASLLMFAAGAVIAHAKGGTAKPPRGAILPASLITPTLPDPVFAVGNPAADPRLFHGFDDTGLIQDATVSADNSACPNVPADAPSRLGGTVTLNNVTYTVPCDMIIQMPANTLTWAEFVKGDATSAPLKVTLKDGAFPSFELHVIGNDIKDERIVGLMFASQQSVNSGTGQISKIDYGTGDLHVKTPSGPVVLQINDPNGRFGRKQSPDSRFSVDDENPTIHAGTGYPMCVPRTDPTVAGGDDPLCPQANRPARMATTVNGATIPAVTQCRNFSVSGLVPPPGSGEISATPTGQYCTQFVMPKSGQDNNVAGHNNCDPTNPTPTKDPTTGMDPCQQAPFEVGDQISWQGTLVHGANAGDPDYISAHTIEANVGIYTYSGHQPSYVAIGEFGVGSADPSATSVTGLAQETQDRMFLESEVTDPKTPVDIYMQDVNADGSVKNRWVTPFEMTGENQLGNPSGGISTAWTGAQPQRDRIRATKAPTGLLSQPTRTVKVAARSLCTPTGDAAGNVDQAALDSCFNKAPKAANDLVPGQYTAPTFEFIFPENVKPGDGLVPNDMWHLPFLVKGEGKDVGPLTPAPW
jgi:hypothetical protein